MSKQSMKLHTSQQPNVQDERAAHQLMKSFLPLRSVSFVDASKIRAISRELSISDIEAEIYFLRELHGIARRLPLKLFPDDQSRERVITAIQDALDNAVDEEEEMLDDLD